MRRSVCLAAVLVAVTICVAAASSGLRRARLNSELVDAVYFKSQIDANRVRTLLAQGADPNAKGPKDVQALSWAARAGAVEPMRLLLDAGADPNCRDGWLSALNLAVGERHPEATELLLSRGANPNNGHHGSSALVLAVSNRDPKIARILLDHGADPNSQDEHGARVLRIARGERAAKVITILKHAGATE